MKFLPVFVFLFGLSLKPSAQRVGVGTTVPMFRLHVHDSVNPDVSINITNSITTDALLRGARLRMFENHLFIANNESGGRLSFLTSSNERMVIAPNGNVGIGTLTPLQRLHVDGGIQFKGPLLTNGNAGTTGQALVSNEGLPPQWQTINSNPQTGFRASASTEQLVPYATETRVQFSIVSFNDGGGYNNVSHLFTASEEGTYNIDANVVFAISGSNYPVTVYLMDNVGTTYAVAYRTIDSYNRNVLLSTTARLTAGNQLAVYVSVGTFGGASAQVISAAAGNYFTCYKVY